MKREELLQEKAKQSKDPQTIFVCDWHPTLAKIPSLLKQHYALLQSNETLSNIFPESPMVAYRRPKTTGQHLIRNDVSPTETRKGETCSSPCGRSRCLLCKSISPNSSITNSRKNITIELKDGGNCRSSNIVYAIRCKKCDEIYVGQTSEELRTRVSKHRHDAKHRPDNNELAAHLHVGHNFDNDIEVFVLQSGIMTEPEREFHEDKWIYRLQTLSRYGGINSKIN